MKIGQQVVVPQNHQINPQCWDRQFKVIGIYEGRDQTVVWLYDAANEGFLSLRKEYVVLLS